MKVGVYFCACGGIITELLDLGALERGVIEAGGTWFKAVELGCSEEGRRWIAEDVRAEKPDRVVVAACSPREHEETFRKAAAEGGLSPFLVNLVNVREQAAWVTEGTEAATEKTLRLIRGALSRVRLQEPFERRFLEVSTDVMVVGAGPSGLKAALALAGAGRKVTLVEKAPILGGMAVRYEEVFPSLECGPCLVEPLIADALHGPGSENIDAMLCSEVVGVKGSFGNFVVEVRTRPRFIDADLCVGCGACIEACPASSPNPFNCGRGGRKAVDFVFFGGLPSVPYIDPEACTRLSGKDGCRACLDACPVEGAVRFDDAPKTAEKTVGAAILAIGAENWAAENLPELGGGLEGVCSWLEAERLFASTGPTGGVPMRADGTTPKRIAFIHCAGSLDEANKPYCSGVCCLGAFKLSQLAAHKIDGVELTHYYRTLVMPGKSEAALYRKAAAGARFVNYGAPGGVSVAAGAEGPVVTCGGGSAEYDMVVLMTPIAPGGGGASLSILFDVPLDGYGFFEELGARVEANSTRTRGVYLAGAGRSPTDLGGATVEGLAAAGAAFSALKPGGKIELEANLAEIDEAKCSGCRTCVGVCPYRAIYVDSATGKSAVNPALCTGCGTCVAACPAAAITGRNFTDAEVMAEIEGLLR